MERIRAKLAGRSADLLCYNELRDLLQPQASYRAGLQEIPLAAIAGSVERCADYTRGFLPLKDSDQQRWARVMAAFVESKPLPPIHVFQVSDVYFVADGNHRVSVAHQLGRTHIEALVSQIQTRVPLSPGTQPGELALAGQYVQFLARTGLDETRPDADLRLTVPDWYPVLEAQIEAHRTFLALERGGEVTVREAAGDWYDEVYQPLAEAIRSQDLLQGLNGWTEADLYVRLCQHRLALERSLGREVELDLAAADLRRQVAAGKDRTLGRLGRRIASALRPLLQPALD